MSQASPEVELELMEKLFVSYFPDKPFLFAGRREQILERRKEQEQTTIYHRFQYKVDSALDNHMVNWGSEL